MKRWHKRLLAPAALIATIVLLRLTLFRPHPIPVTVQTVSRGRVEETVVNSRAGTVSSRSRAEMSPAIQGLVVEIPVEKGQRIEKGMVLLRLDDREYQAQVTLAARSLDALRASASEARLASEQAERNRLRAEGLARQGLLSEQRLEEARTAAESAAAALNAATEIVKQAEASLAAAKAILAKTIMEAPFDGVVLDITAEVGEWISPSPPGVFIPPVIDVIDPDSLYVSAPLDEADVARVGLGLPARITMDAFRDRSFPGRITYISSYVETRQEQNRTLKVEAVFDERDLPDNVLPGLSADIEVILNARDDVLRIPTYALLEGDRVLALGSRRLEERKVEVGLRNWEFAEILSGLTEGERVVVSLDRPEVKRGARVRVAEEIAK